MHARRHLLVVALCLVLPVACGSDKDDGPGPTTTLRPVVGEAFSDPEGTYTLTVAEGWVPLTGVAAEIEAWAVSRTEGEFAPNVNVLTQNTGDLDLNAYLDLSTENRGVLPAFRLVQRAVVRGPEGQELGVLFYTGAPGKPLSFLAYIAMGSRRARVATLTTPPGSFDRIRPGVEPYLATLRAT